MADTSEQDAMMDTCRLQAIQLRASKKMQLWETLDVTADILNGLQKKLKTKERTSFRAFKGFGGGAYRTKSKR